MATPHLPTWVRLALGVLAILAPRELRERWRREWTGELAVLWQHRNGFREGYGPGRGGWGPGRPSLRVPGLLLVATRDALHLRLLRRRLTGPAPGTSNPRPAPATPGLQHGHVPMLSPLLQDLRFSLRTLRGAPWFSLVTVATLALGIGASVAMFGVLHRVLLRPLPFPDAQALVVGRATFRGELNPWVAGADYYDYRDQAEGFDALGALLPFPMEMTVSGNGEAERVAGNTISPNLLTALGVQPALGRGFRAQDGQEGAADVVLLSHGYWQRHTGGDPSVLGSALTLDGDPFTVVGILPRGFHFLVPADLFVPMRPDRFAASTRDRHNWYLVGRLAPEVTLEEAQASVDVVSVRLQEAYPDTNAEKALRLTGLRDVLTEDYRLSLWILTGAVVLVLLIACGNAAGILLARAPARRFELCIRGAMGAPRGRLVGQLVAESLTLSLAGGAVGTVLALWFQGLMLEYLAMERLGLTEAGFSWPVLGVALGVSLLAGLLAGVYPALRAAHFSVSEGLKAGHRGKSDGGSAFRSGLVVAQVAVSVVLLAGSGLLVKSLLNLQALDPGFRSRGLVTAEVQLPFGSYPREEARIRFFSALRERLQAIPGVESVALTSHLPISDFGNIYRAVGEGREEDPQRIFLRSVFPGYLETLEIPVLTGRSIEAGDDGAQRKVVVLSRTAAQRLLPQESQPIGKRVALNMVNGPLWMEVVGVVGDVRLSRLEEDPEAALYVPYPQRPRNALSLALKTRIPPETLAGTVKEVVRSMDPGVPVSRVATLESLVSQSMAERRVITLSLSLLALLPLTLAAVGLFAVLAYQVARRRHEMGVRLALGARAGEVGMMVLRQGMGMVAVGAALGLAGAWAGTRLLENLLFGVGATDPWTFVAVTGLVLGVALLASSVPVWRAVRSDPRVMLEAE